MKKVTRKIKDILNQILSQGLFYLPEKYPMDSIEEVKVDLKEIRVALVKQDVYTNLYCAPTFSSFSDTIGSSLRHTGPAAFLKIFNCDYHIVKVEADLECNIWKEKITDCGQGDQDYYFRQRLREAVYPPNMDWQQGALAKSVNDISWSDYDIIISVDLAVPERIVRRHTQALWCYYVSEPCMRSYKKSRETPLAGYDIFLNQRFSPRHFSLNKLHELDFPFAFQYSGIFDDFRENITEPVGIFIEAHSASILSDADHKLLEQFGPISTTSTATASILRALLNSRYFVRLGGRRLWGNSMVEAVACGTLALGNPGEYKNRSLYCSGSRIRTFDDCMRLIDFYETHSNRRHSVLADQTQRLNHFCFYKPLASLLSSYQNKNIAK